MRCNQSAFAVDMDAVPSFCARSYRDCARQHKFDDRVRPRVDLKTKMDWGGGGGTELSYGPPVGVRLAFV